MLSGELGQLEQAFRSSWRGFCPQHYAQYLEHTAEANRLELLTRILSVELEFAFQPPPNSAQQSTAPPPPAHAEACPQFEGLQAQFQEDDQEDDQRVKPCVPLFLLQFPELAQRTDFVIRLIVLEYALRLRYDPQPPNPESYLPLCQQGTDQLIRMLELTESKLPVARCAASASGPISCSDSTIKEATLSASISIDPLPLNLGCFLLLRLLGRGGMGYVHSAIDLRSTAQVAVKVMRRVDAWSIYRFIEEFRWLSQLSHPNLVKLYDAFCEGDVRYFSMELVEGKSVREWFRRIPENRPSRWQELQQVLGQFASAINYLHEHNVLHCDIKCSNMMIASGHRAVLLDLGLAIRSGQQHTLVGTLQYMAPEVIRGEPATAASDWYSFGVMVYEVLTDSFPPIRIDLSEGSSKSDSYHLDFAQLQHNLRDYPEDLRRLCLDLLQPQAEKRPNGREVVARLDIRQAIPQLLANKFECLGRDAELAAIDHAVQMAEPKASLVVLDGESGIGKSTLMQCWSQAIRAPDSLLLSVRCYRQDHTPVRLLNALMQELTTAVRYLPEANWKPALEKQATAIRMLFPQVQQLAPDSHPLSNHSDASKHAYPEAAHDVSISSFIQWLLELSHRQRLVICVDDAQWADAESLRTLKRLLNRPEGFRGTLLLVDESLENRLCDLFRQEPTSQPPAIALYRMTHISLQPLAPDSCRRLLSQWAAAAQVELGPMVATDITARSSGNPFLLQEFFRTYVHYVRGGDSSGSDWRIADSQRSVRRRFSMLPQVAENILQFLAVADQSLSFHQLQMVSRVLPHELQRTLSLLASQGWVRSRGSELESDVEIAHDNFRRAVYQSIPTERLHRRHYRLARVLSCETPPPWARVAGHYWSAEYFLEASACYLEAARNAMASAGAEEAIEFLNRADHPDARRTASEQLRVNRMKADCLARVGNSLAAAELYDRLLADAQDEEQATNLRCLSGEQNIRAGQLDAGLARLKMALKQLGLTSWKRTKFSYFCLACRTLRLAFSDLQKLKQGALNSVAFNETERCLNRLSPPLTFLDNQLGPDLILRMTRLSEKSGSNFDRALALLRSGVLLSFAGRKWRHKALQRLRLGRQIARASRSHEAQATGHFNMFVWYIQRGQLSAAARTGKLALRLYRNCPASTQWEQQFLQWAMLQTSWQSNRLQELMRSTIALRHSAHQRSDPMSLFWMHVDAAHRADLVTDHVDLARTSLAIASAAISNQSFQSPRFFLWLSRIHQALYENDAAQAQAILKEDWRQLDKSLVMRTNHYRWLALSARVCCNLVALRNQLPHPTSYLDDARQCVRRMLRLEEPVFVAYGQAYSLAIEAIAATLKTDKLIRHVLPRPAEWEAKIKHLHALGHHQLAVALQWQCGCYVSTEQPNTLQAEAAAQFQHQGCVAPEKLLNIILPLPAT